jgi:hypothetical protein
VRGGDNERMMDDSGDPANLDENFEPPADFRNRRKRLLAVVEDHGQQSSKKQKTNKG